MNDMETWIVFLFLTLVVGLSCLLCQLQKYVFYKQIHNAMNRLLITYDFLTVTKPRSPNFCKPFANRHVRLKE